ncbi:MAG: cytochrome c3 family protein [Acidobacteriota bacterium]|nr:cytochrome c3 family protein [Acidobacteriota bacterium]MDH3524447.1 cytochrome c3 family protein [Acidobacteriota bacterium]
MKRALLIIALGSVCASVPAMGQTVVGTSHDMSSALPITQRVCVFCHTPHQPEGPPQINTDPLWNHTLSTVASYGVYSSDTLDAVPADIGGLNTVSNLCMSCHDATVGLGSLYNDPNIVGGEETPTNAGTVISGNANMGTDLSNDHPVNFIYDTALATLDGELVDPAGNPTAPPATWLFGGSVQCASCHDPHDNTFTPFLIATNVQSAMCLTCHLK